MLLSEREIKILQELGLNTTVSTNLSTVSQEPIAAVKKDLPTCEPGFLNLTVSGKYLFKSENLL